jgi:Transcriptional regulators
MGVQIMPEIDEKDLKILEVLQEEGNITFVELGKRLNMSPSTAYIRVRRLKQMGLIKKVVSIIDYQRLGFNVRAFIFIKIDPKKLEAVARELANIENILQIQDITGEPSLLALVIARDNEHLAQILDQIGKIDGVVSTNTMIALRTLKESYRVKLT